MGETDIVGESQDKYFSSENNENDIFMYLILNKMYENWKPWIEKKFNKIY